MDFDYIIVQAGGKGTRMEYQTANKPKALVPVSNLPMIFHLFRKYPDKRYVIIADYKSDVMRDYLAAFATVKYLIAEVHGKSGTCAGIRIALEKIPDRQPFMLIWSDLILSDHLEIPEEVDDYIGLSKGFRCRWRYHDNRFEEIPSEDMGVAGFFLFKDKEKLANVPEEGELIRWMQSQNQIYRTLGLSQTKEYGLISEWNKKEENKTVGRCRPFNRILIEENTITKEYIDEQGKSLSIREKAWYKYVISRGFSRIPLIYSFDPFKMQRIHGRHVFEYNLTYEERRRFIKKLVDCLKELHELGTAPTDYFSLDEAYIGKTFKRLEKIRNMVPFGNNRYITVNGRACRNIFFFQNELRQKFNNYHCSDFKLLHGDNTFSNILLDENDDPVLIDPRGYFGFSELFGDVAYDWAKLYYSIVGNYDQFNLKNFRLYIMENEVKIEINSSGWEDTEHYFLDLVKDEASEETIKLIHAIIWLSLTTYAWEDYDSICGAFYNGLHYLEEIL